MGIAEERKSVFEAFSAQAWPFQFHVELVVKELHGGTPRNPNVVRSWLMAKAGYKDEHEIEEELDRIFARGDQRSDAQVAEEATQSLADRQVNGLSR